MSHQCSDDLTFPAYVSHPIRAIHADKPHSSFTVSAPRAGVSTMGKLRTETNAE